MEGGEASFCMYAVLNMGYKPSDWLKLNIKERAFIIASIKIKIDEEKKQAQKIKARRK